jgi:hypothetical protein
MANSHDTLHANGKGGASRRQGKTVVDAAATATRSRRTQEPLAEPLTLQRPAVRDGWLEFELPQRAPAKDHAVYASIRNVHRQAYIDLAFLGRCRWNGYAAVESKLKIAATALQSGARARAESLVKEAQAAYREQLAYLSGVALGVGLLALLQLGLHRSIDSLNGVITEQFTLQMVVFAGMGTLASVLTRIGQFKIESYATRSLVVISGASRPLVAAFVAFATCAFLRSDLATVTVNGHDVSNVSSTTFIYLSAAFLCGFSERFGKHVLDRAASALGGGSG